ncbi:MAG TPA: CsbD family protein [Terriglobales bacterium]|nr:CsbD family protein [Terriglobales bacterium]
MNADQLQGKWHQMRGAVKQQWGRLTDDDAIYIDGAQDKLIGRVEERYGVLRQEARRLVQRWLDDMAA